MRERETRAGFGASYVGGDPSLGEILDYLRYFEHRGEMFPIKIQSVSSGYSNTTYIQSEFDPPLTLRSNDQTGIGSKEKFRVL